ncbi:MAG TPA: thiol reductant ABC exporter subunit CydC [Streptosporangiaceae bacterium]|nr:thiol reductant ABC exporter subunit CydC [Streptosporangiaceae bacterium]
MTAVAPPPTIRPSRSPLLRMLALARPLRGRLAIAALAGAAATGSGVALLAVSGFLLARASQHPNIVAISIAVVAVRALGISRGVFRYAERLGSHDVAFRVLADVRVTIYRRLERLAPAGLAAFRSGDLLARLISDVDATQDLFIRGIAPPLAAALVGAGSVLAAVALLAPAGLVLCMGLLLAGVAAPLLAARTARTAAERSAPARGELGALLTDLLAGAADVHACNAQGELLARVTAADAEITRLSRRTSVASGLGAGLGAAAAGATLWGVLLLGVAATGSGTLSRVPLAVITLTALAAFEAVTALPAAAIQIAQACTSAGRITAVLDAPDPVTEPAEPLPVPSGVPHVRLCAAQVRYGASGPLVIDGVDLDLPPGKRMAIIGPTGAGKSTIAAVLLRFTDVCGGRATIDGNDLTRYSADDVRSIIGGCPQDPHIFDTTVRANLQLAKPDATGRELEAAAKRARLLGWISSLPEGWDTQVGAHGARMSGGQCQRVALARALLANPAVLILDEPTAHLDAENRRSLMADLLAVTVGRSLLMITHELAGLEAMDEIIVLRRGKVVERGTHVQLVERAGEYWAMWQASQTAWEGSLP